MTEDKQNGNDCAGCSTRARLETVDLTQIKFTDDARATLERSAEEAADTLGVSPQELKEKLFQNMRLAPDGRLFLALRLKDAESEMFVEAPPGSWERID